MLCFPLPSTQKLIANSDAIAAICTVLLTDGISRSLENVTLQKNATLGSQRGIFHERDTCQGRSPLAVEVLGIGVHQLKL